MSSRKSSGFWCLDRRQQLAQPHTKIFTLKREYVRIRYGAEQMSARAAIAC
jgi:hypothetical protein